MTAVEFLDKLEQQGLLDEGLVSKLRNQVADARKPVSAQKMAKLLIDKGHLTAFQAKKLIDSGAPARPTRPQKPAAPQPAAPEPIAADDGLELLDADDDDLGLELVDDEAVEDDGGLELLDTTPPQPTPTQSAPAKTAAKTPPRESSVLTPLDDLPGLTPVDSGALTPFDSGIGLMSSSESALQSSGAAPLSSGGLDSLDPLSGDLTATDDPMSAPAAAAKPPRSLAKKVPKVKGQSQWDTPLMVLGGGGLILLAVLAVALYRFIFATSASVMFEAATDAYRAQSYTQAISLYQDFLGSYPRDPQAGAAWVLIRTAQLRQVVESKDWERALETAKSVIKEIDASLAANPPPAPELPAAFNEHGRPELASLLPDIAAGFATQATNTRNTAEAERLVGLAEGAMTLVNNPSYIPSSLRESVAARIDTIQENMGVARRNINRDKALVQAQGEIDAALAKNDTPAAFQIRKALLKTYPSLETVPAVVEAVRKTTEKERELVSLLEEPRQPLTQAESGNGATQVVTAAVNGESAPGVAGVAVPFLVRGAVYGFDAATGQVLWRRPVGMKTQVHPQRVSQEPEADVILVDGQSQELVRVAGKTGQLVWRLPLGAAAQTPTLLGDRLFVPTESGLLYEVNAQTGESGRQIKFPQPLRSPPAVDEARGLLFQVGEHSNLYILSSETLDCKAVYFLNHAAGTVITPPVQSRGQIFIAENAGADYCLIHTLPTTDAADKLQPSQAPFRLRGNVVVPPFVYERRVVVVTDLGGVSLFEIDTTNKEQPVTKVAEALPTLREPAPGYALADAGQLWVADSRLARYEVQAARGELVRKAIRDEGGVYAAPLQRFGNVLLHARRQANSEGVVVTAAAADTLRPYWVSDVGAPMVGLIANPGAARVAAVSAQGDLFQLTQDVIQAGRHSQPRQPAAQEPEAAFQPPLLLPDGRLAFPGVVHKDRILIFDPQAADAPPKVVELQTPEGRATAAPVAFQGGLLVPSSAGLVYLVDPDTGQELALPLRPPMEPGEELVWQAPAVTADGKEFIIANDRKKLFRVTLRQQPKPHLAALTTRDLDGVIVDRLAAAGDVVYGVQRTPQGDALLTFELPALSFRITPLADRLAWGPHRVGESVLLATYDSLLRLDGAAEPRWTRPLPYGLPVAPPGELNGDYFFASVGGAVWRVAADTGQELGKTDLNQPLAAGPAVVGSRLLLGGSDGVLHFTPLDGELQIQ